MMRWHLHHALIEHGFGDFAEAGNVGAVDVVDEAVGYAKADALVVVERY